LPLINQLPGSKREAASFGCLFSGRKSLHVPQDALLGGWAGSASALVKLSIDCRVDGAVDPDFLKRFEELIEACGSRRVLSAHLRSPRLEPSGPHLNFQPQIAIARGVLVVDENLLALIPFLEEQRFRVLTLKPGMNDDRPLPPPIQLKPSMTDANESF
jgi:hypothetical protein